MYIKEDLIIPHVSNVGLIFKFCCLCSFVNNEAVYRIRLQVAVDVMSNSPRFS